MSTLQFTLARVCEQGPTPLSLSLGPCPVESVWAGIAIRSRVICCLQQGVPDSQHELNLSRLLAVQQPVPAVVQHAI